MERADLADQLDDISRAYENGDGVNAFGLQCIRDAAARLRHPTDAEIEAYADSIPDAGDDGFWSIAIAAAKWAREHRG